MSLIVGMHVEFYNQNNFEHFNYILVYYNFSFYKIFLFFEYKYNMYR